MSNQKSRRGAKKRQTKPDGNARPPDDQSAKKRKETRDQQAERPQPDKHGGSGAGRQQGGSGSGRERG